MFGLQPESGGGFNFVFEMWWVDPRLMFWGEGANSWDFIKFCMLMVWGNVGDAGVDGAVLWGGGCEWIHVSWWRDGSCWGGS